MTPTVVTEPRRWAAFHTTGIYTLLMSIQGSREDLAGGLDNDQLDLVTHSARRIALLCLRIRSLLADGLPEVEGDPLADPFAGLAEPEGLLAAAAAVCAATSVAEAGGAVGSLDDAVAALVADLGFAAEPKSIRTPAGLFPALRLTRELLPLNKDAGLPLVFPQSWVVPKR